MRPVRIDFERIFLFGPYEGLAIFDHGSEIFLAIMVDSRYDLPPINSLVAHDGKLQDFFKRDECSFVESEPQLEFFPLSERRFDTISCWSELKGCGTSSKSLQAFL